MFSKSRTKYCISYISSIRLLPWTIKIYGIKYIIQNISRNISCPGSAALLNLPKRKPSAQTTLLLSHWKGEEGKHLHYYINLKNAQRCYSHLKDLFLWKTLFYRLRFFYISICFRTLTHKFPQLLSWNCILKFVVII